MTADRAAIRARLEAATQGPWTATTYEATMNDYTVETISRCDAGIERTADALIAEGIDPDEAVVWDGAQWRPAHDPYEGN